MQEKFHQHPQDEESQVIIPQLVRDEAQVRAELRNTRCQPCKSTLTCPIRCDGAQLHGQRIAHVSEMLQCMAIAPRAVKKPLPTQNRAVSQIQPEVLPQVTPGTLPATRKSHRTIRTANTSAKDCHVKK